MRRSEAVRSNSALYVDSLGATSDRGSSAAYTGPSDVAPLLKFGRRDRKPWPEPAQQPPPMQHHSPGPKTRFGAPARRAAASAVVNEHWNWKLWPTIVLVYRGLELCANFVCLAGLLWIVNPLVMLFPFVALWYLPAAYSVDSFLKPLKVPLILFVVDDFSLLGIHPDARNMRFMYIICVFRVLFLLSIIPLCSKWSPIPQVLKDAVINQATMDIFVEEAPDTIGEMPDLGSTVALAEVWSLLGLLTFLAAILWLLLTLPMICGSPCCGCPSPVGGWCNEPLLKKVDELSAKVDNASGSEPRRCRKLLEKIRNDDCERLSLVTEFRVGIQAFWILLHLVFDVINTCTFILHRDFVYAALLSFTLAMTLVYQCGAMGGGPLGIVTEAMLSIERGLYTENFLVIVQGDKGVQKIPAMTLKIYGLPFAAKSVFQVTIAALSISLGVLGLAKFIYRQYDLGVEREGLEPAATALAQADAGDQESDLEPEASQKEEEKFLQEGAPSIGVNEEGQLCPGEMLRGRRENDRGNWTPPPPPPAPWELPGRRARSSASSSGTRRSGGTSASPGKAHGRMQTVRLDTSAGMLDIVVRHDWAPNGARRFLDLVAGGHFDGLFFYRAVSGCIAQFGLPVRRPWPPLPDDHAQGVPFLFGAVGFVSNGYETRQSTIFICLGDMSHCIGQKPWEMPIGAVSQSTLQTLDKIYTGYGEIREFNGVGPEVAQLMSEGNSYLRSHFPHLTHIRGAWLVDVPPASIPRTPESDRGPLSVLDRFARHHDADDQRGAYHLPGQAAARRSSPPACTSSPGESSGSRHSFGRRSHQQRGGSQGRVRLQHMAASNDGDRQGYARSQSASTEEDRLGDRCASIGRQHPGLQQSSATASSCSGGLGLQLGHAVWTRATAAGPSEAARACCRPLDPGRVQQDPRAGRMQDAWQGYAQEGHGNADSAAYNRHPVVVAQQQPHALVAVPRSELSPGPTARNNMMRAATHGGAGGDGGGASFPRLSPLELQSSPQPLPTRDSHNYSFPAERLQFLQTLPESQPLRVTEPVATAARQAHSTATTTGAPRAGAAPAYTFR